MTISVPEGSALLGRVRDAVATRIIGQDAAIEDVLVAFLARGHALVEGVPGTAKTLLVRTIASAMAMRFTRIQFTPDLMPADVTGVALYRDPARGFEFQPGRYSRISYSPTRSTARRRRRKPRSSRRWPSGRSRPTA